MTRSPQQATNTPSWKSPLWRGGGPAGWMRRGCWAAGILLVALLGTPVSQGVAQETEQPRREPQLPFEPGRNWMALTRDHEVWIDLKAKQVLVGGRICLREGLLEMFACPKGTKEHEAIVAVNTPARYVHAGLVALGAKPGPPVQFAPVYKPAQGTEIGVTVIWKDLEGQEHRAEAQSWVKHIKSGKALTYPWVFAGSGFWRDEEAGEQFYYADGGEFICVSNFATAMLDLPVESSDANDTLMFCAFSERIPPRETRVFLLLTPQLTEKPAGGKPLDAGPDEKASPQDAEKAAAVDKSGVTESSPSQGVAKEDDEGTSKEKASQKDETNNPAKNGHRDAPGRS